MIRAKAARNFTKRSSYSTDTKWQPLKHMQGYTFTHTT